jgi:thiosulfate reductase cytochrome b subunit
MLKRMKKADPGDPVLVKKHPLAIRWFHWINFPVLSIMVWSGIVIFYASRNSGKITIFGRRIPDWAFAPPLPKWAPFQPGGKHWSPFDMDAGHAVFFNLRARLAEGMGWHFLFMWFFALNGLAYVLYLVFSKEWKVIVPKLSSFKTAVLVALSDLHLAKEPKTDGKYNDAQKVAYTAVILMGFVMLLSGFAIYKPTQAYWLTALFFGYENARWVHFWTTIMLCGFFLVHVAQVVRAGWNNFRSMVTGYALEYRQRTPKSEPEPQSKDQAA